MSRRVVPFILGAATPCGFAVILLLLAIPSAWLLARDGKVTGKSLSARVKRGEFKVLVTTAGELRARNFVQVQGPPNAQNDEGWLWRQIRGEDKKIMLNQSVSWLCWQSEANPSLPAIWGIAG